MFNALIDILIHRRKEERYDTGGWVIHDAMTDKYPRTSTTFAATCSRPVFGMIRIDIPTFLHVEWTLTGSCRRSFCLRHCCCCGGMEQGNASRTG